MNVCICDKCCAVMQSRLDLRRREARYIKQRLDRWNYLADDNGKMGNRGSIDDPEEAAKVNQ